MNIYVKAILELYDLFIRFIHFLQYIILFAFNNQIIYIKHINNNNEVAYLIPFFQLSFHNTCIPGISFYDPFDILELCHVRYVRHSRVEHLACKNRSVIDVQIKVNHLGHNEYYERRHSIAKKYIFVEIGPHNITDSYKEIGWSLIQEKMKVSEYKALLNLPIDDKTLDLTDADNLNIEELANDDVIE